MTVNSGNTEIKLSLSFVLVLLTMLIVCDEKIVMLCLTASLLHECGHLFFMLLYGEKILSIDFGAFGVRIERACNTSLSYKKEAIVALGGILINFFLAFLSIIYYYLMKSQTALIFALINLLTALFNCIPVYVLDMGRALKCVLMLISDEAESERVLSIISIIFTGSLAVFTVLYSAFISVNVSLIAVTVYLFVITLFKKWS